MGSALWIGTTGLNASSMQIDVIGNNLANSNTPGYKADNMYFSSLLTQSLATGANSLNIGQGVRVSSIATQFAAGAMQTTGNATDLAIDGDGFFAVKDGTGAEFFTAQAPSTRTRTTISSMRTGISSKVTTPSRIP